MLYGQVKGGGAQSSSALEGKHCHRMHIAYGMGSNSIMYKDKVQHKVRDSLETKNKSNAALAVKLQTLNSIGRMRQQGIAGHLYTALA